MNQHEGNNMNQHETTQPTIIDHHNPWSLQEPSPHAPGRMAGLAIYGETASKGIGRCIAGSTDPSFTGNATKCLNSQQSTALQIMPVLRCCEGAHAAYSDKSTCRAMCDEEHQGSHLTKSWLIQWGSKTKGYKNAYGPAAPTLQGSTTP